MSNAAPKHFADIASALGVLLDNYKPEKANHTFLTLYDLSEQLPSESSLRKVIEQQMSHILTSEFPVSPDTTNKTMVVMGQLKDSLKDGDPMHAELDRQMARVLEIKLSKINGGSVSSAKPFARSESPAPKLEVEPAKEPEKVEKSESKPEEKPEPAPAPAPEPKPEPKEEVKAEAAPASDELDEVAHKLQLIWDQMSESTKKAFDEFKPVIDNGGAPKAYADHLRKNQSGSAKGELEKLLILAEKIESAPRETDEFQALYDQVDAKHKDPKSGVFSIFQRDYAGNAKRFAVLRTEQYAKYVPADEAHQRMIEDLHKLIEQANKNLKEDGNGKASSGGAAPADAGKGANGRSFFHG